MQTKKGNLDVTTSLSAPITFINNPEPSMTRVTALRDNYLSRKITRADKNKILLDVIQEMQCGRSMLWKKR